MLWSCDQSVIDALLLVTLSRLEANKTADEVCAVYWSDMLWYLSFRAHTSHCGSELAHFRPVAADWLFESRYKVSVCGSASIRPYLCVRERCACLSPSLARPAAVLYSPLTSLKKPNQFRSSTQKGQKGCTCELYLYDKRNKYFWTRMWCLLILSISFLLIYCVCPQNWVLSNTGCMCLFHTTNTQKLNKS